ncbi:voltage-gated potassium channel [Pseudidiomarina planktonica]|uniref:Voltage-gated potassium channel n=1 Tax=Pseudidiomarina planktonica TaxID=1323738 RepID=A0A1Y6EKE5_9GAMM|nr:ion transporter [Pseudidiomarina planktonica]RUO66022.1 ion transporter [Pseudidiomarina planktonica]SMQ61032.1 voltage-gated potassium channel [Pseudidiomarina planktonica]
MSIRQQAATILDGQIPPFRPGYWLNAFLMLLILLNVAAVIIESITPIYNEYTNWFLNFEFFSVMVFSLEYVLRIWSAPELPKYHQHSAFSARWRYAISPMALIDLLAIAPFYLSLFISIDMRFLRALRLLRIFKFSRHSRALQLLGTVLRNEGSNLLAAFSVLFVLLILASSGIYMIEANIQPDKFGSIPEAMWWAMATLTTVGYGDVTPITAGGKFFGGMITIVGMGMVALPAGILASGFAEQLAHRRESFKLVVNALMARADQEAISAELIEEVRQALRIDTQTAQRILTEIKSQATNEKG